MTTLGHTARTEDEGLLHVYRQINRMGHVWRDFLRHDVGIDLVLEIVMDKRATGLLIAVQVKSGNAYFRREKNGKIKVAVSPSHVRYWYEYAVPVILIVYSPTSKQAYWKAIDTYDLLKAEGGGTSVEIDKERVFDHTSADALEALSKEHRNRARGFGLSYRSQSDKANSNRWSQLTKILHILLERSREDYVPQLSPKEEPEKIEEREHNTNSALLREAEFLAELIRWDLSVSKGEVEEKAQFSTDAFSGLRAILFKSREAWQGTYLEEWLLMELGGVVEEWRADVLDFLRSNTAQIKSNWDFRCPVCYSSEYVERRCEEDLSYSLGAIKYTLYRDNVACMRCGTPFIYEWGACGPCSAIQSLTGEPEGDTNDSSDVPF